jgi:hypothetical protein
MPTNRIYKIFRQWVKENRERFNFQPYISFSTQRQFGVRFSKLTPRIYTVISKKGGNFIQVSRNGEMWDGLIDFDAFYDRRSDGKYFCKLCKDPEFYPSRQEFLIRHSWEPMLEWMNNTFTETTWLCLYESDGGSTWVYLKQEDEAEQERTNEHFVETFPVLTWKDDWEMISNMDLLADEMMRVFDLIDRHKF